MDSVGAAFTKCSSSQALLTEIIQYLTFYRGILQDNAFIPLFCKDSKLVSAFHGFVNLIINEMSLHFF